MKNALGAQTTALIHEHILIRINRGNGRNDYSAD